MLNDRDQALEQSVHGNGLGEEFIDAGVARLTHMRDAGMARQHNDRHKRVGRVGSGADLPDDIEARHAFHHPVENDDVGICFAQNRERALAILGFVDLNSAEGLKDGHDEFAHVRIVVHHKYLQPVEAIAAQNPNPQSMRAAAFALPSLPRIYGLST